MNLTLIESARWNCPRCKANNIVCVEHADDGDRVKCGTCAVYFHRVGWTYRFVSADSRRVFIPEASIHN